MGSPYSLDLRERVQSVVDSGASRRAAARLFGVNAKLRGEASSPG
jgi:hypothetical protein